jgi:hypothetical protein
MALGLLKEWLHKLFPSLTRPVEGTGPMFHAVMKAAIEGARTLAQMDELSRQLW